MGEACPTRLGQVMDRAPIFEEVRNIGRRKAVAKTLQLQSAYRGETFCLYCALTKIPADACMRAHKENIPWLQQFNR